MILLLEEEEKTCIDNPSRILSCPFIQVSGTHVAVMTWQGEKTSEDSTRLSKQVEMNTLYIQESRTTTAPPKRSTQHGSSVISRWQPDLTGILHRRVIEPHSQRRHRSHSPHCRPLDYPTHRRHHFAK